MSEYVVLDTSTLVSAVLRPGSIPDLAVQKALEHLEVCASVATLTELEAVLRREKFDRYADIRRRQSFIDDFKSNCCIFALPLPESVDPAPLCRDARDNKFLALALAARATAIVSSDDDLLVLHP